MYFLRYLGTFYILIDGAAAGDEGFLELSIDCGASPSLMGHFDCSVGNDPSAGGSTEGLPSVTGP